MDTVHKQNFLISFFKKLLIPSKANMSFGYPDRWQLQEFAPSAIKQAKVNVLVISYLFPHPDQPGLGSFVLEQIKGLQNTEQDINVRVISGRPYHISLKQIRNPLRTLRHPRCMLRKLSHDIYNFVRGLHNFFSYYKACNQSWWSIEGVSVKYLPYPFYGDFWTHGWGYQKSLTKSIKKLKETFDFDVIHAHTGYLDGNAARKIASTFNRPCIITEHTGPFTILTEHPSIRRTTIKALNNAQHLVAVSEAQRQNILSCLKDKQSKVHVIPNIVDFDRFYPASSWTPDPAAPKILFVGYFTPVKNISLLLNAFQRVLIEKPLATLTLVGGGYTLALKSALSNNIEQAEAGVIYLSEEGPDNYLVRDWNGIIQTGRLDGVDLSHLELQNLNDLDFKTSILMVTSGAAHTIGGVHPADYTQQIMQEVDTLNLTDSVKVTGPVPHEEVSNFMRNHCDIFALSSVSESFGCVVAEALASGRPVVSTRCGGPEDIITEDWMGVTCENHNPDALAEAILNLSDRLPMIDPNRLRKSAEDRFSAKVISEQYMKLYQPT
ncbi:MAG: glycosyltransferase [Legionellaceae bacterium]|nr:glycosyltransferase [Legionellaceae bacterium]